MCRKLAESRAWKIALFSPGKANRKLPQVGRANERLGLPIPAI